jgi:hypothetical protein
VAGIVDEQNVALAAFPDELADSRLDALLGRSEVGYQSHILAFEAVATHEHTLHVLHVVYATAQVGADDAMAIDADQDSFLLHLYLLMVLLLGLAAGSFNHWGSSVVVPMPGLRLGDLNRKSRQRAVVKPFR